MEEYIKILEDLKNKWELNAFGDMVNVLSLNEIKAIENLLKRYKELEEGCKTCVVRNDLNDYVENSIPISVIENKIDEYKKEYEDISDRNSGCLTLYREKEIELEHKIEVLEELLETKK